MANEDRFEGVDFVIEVPRSKIDYSKQSSDPLLNKNNVSQHYYDVKEKQKLNLSIASSDRNGQPRTLEELQEIQNRIMGRDPNFSKLPAAEKEKIMFRELQDWQFSQMPSLKELEEEFKKPVTVSVDSLDKADTVGTDKPHINLKSNNVRLEIVSDGRTITFNNHDELVKYREAVKKQNENANKKTTVEIKAKIASDLHDSREFE
ncbi:MAG: hypothetical protein IJ772_05185 [Bacilli bacterium]|nr:hypothetical protein [Bacilli bacterium]